MHNEFMAFVNDEQTAQTIRSWAERQGFSPDSVQIGGASLFATLLESEAPPKFALVDFDNQEQPIQSAARLVSLCGSSCRLVALGAANDVTIFRGMLAAGLSDYLVKPVTPEILTQTMVAITRGVGGVATTVHDAKTIVVVGVRGGVGASTFATNIAWIMAHEMKRKSALLDMDLQYGTSALALDIEPGHGLRDVLSSPQRVDGLMIAGALISESENLGIFSAEEPVEDALHIDSNATMALIKELRVGYQAIVIDMPRHLIAHQKRVLATANEIVLLTEMSLVGIRDTLRIRSTLKNLGSTARITQIASKISPSRPAGVDDATFTKGAQAKIDFILPDDHKALVIASNTGKTLSSVAPTAALTKTIRDVAKHLIAQEDKKGAQAKKPASLLGGLFGSGAKEAPKK